MKKKASGLQQQITLTHIIKSQISLMVKRNIWTEDEDNQLKNIIQDYGEDDWAFITQEFNKSPKVTQRNSTQCRQRWREHLSSKVKKQKWTIEDKEKLINICLSSKNKKVEISKQFKKRPKSDIKNTLYNSLRKGIRRLCKIVNIENGTNRVKKIKSRYLIKAITSLSHQIRSQELEIDFQSQILKVSDGSIKEQENRVMDMDAHVIEILKEKLQKLLNNSENQNQPQIDKEHSDTGKGPSELEMYGQEDNDPIINYQMTHYPLIPQENGIDQSGQEDKYERVGNVSLEPVFGCDQPARIQSISKYFA